MITGRAIHRRNEPMNNISGKFVTTGLDIPAGACGIALAAKARSMMGSSCPMWEDFTAREKL
jgi:hypothetical protein